VLGQLRRLRSVREDNHAVLGADPTLGDGRHHRPKDPSASPPPVHAPERRGGWNRRADLASIDHGRVNWSTRTIAAVAAAPARSPPHWRPGREPSARRPPPRRGPPALPAQAGRRPGRARSQGRMTRASQRADEVVGVRQDRNGLSLGRARLVIWPPLPWPLTPGHRRRTYRKRAPGGGTSCLGTTVASQVGT
jgi:hypothetical protein